MSVEICTNDSIIHIMTNNNLILYKNGQYSMRVFNNNVDHF